MYELINKIREWLDAKTPLPLLCQVTAVDIEGQTCDVQPLDGIAPIEEVHLTAAPSILAGLLPVPAIGSTVLINWLDNGNTAYVQQFGELQKLVIRCENVEFNGGGRGGLVNWPELKKQVDKDRDFLKDFYDTYSATVAVPNDGGAAIQAAVKLKMATAEHANYANLENDRIRHD